MKKILAIVLVSMFGFAFGCGPKAPATEATAPETPAVEAPAAPEEAAVPAEEGAPAAEAPAAPEATP